MFRRALVPSSRYNSLCLGTVHRNQPEVAQFGTILQIVNVERQEEAVFLDVIGVDRFRLEDHEDNMGSVTGHFDILDESVVPVMSITPELVQVDRVSKYAVELAGSILQALQQLGEEDKMPNVLHSQSNGILGPAWLENMISIHGPLPEKETPAAVAWWAAAVLPVSSHDLYILLRTISLVDRLELIISWMKALQNQWKTYRDRAIHAFSQIPQH